MHYIDSQKTLNIKENHDVQDKVTPTPPPICKIFSHQIYTDLKNDQISSARGWFQPTGWEIETLFTECGRFEKAGGHEHVFMFM